MTNGPISLGQDPFDALLSEKARAVEDALDKLLPRPDGAEARLIEAMRYAALGSGKRIRAFLVLAAAEVFHVSSAAALRVAAAIECLHTYALVHDDLPAIDDDDIRRGKPALHLAFDEATAILAGDALLAFAFELISAPETHADGFVRSELVLELARASGPRGLAGGQMIDVTAEPDDLNIGQFMRLQRLKVGTIFAFCCEAGAIMARASNYHRHALQAFAHDMAMAYQMSDDLLAVTRVAANDASQPNMRAAREGLSGRTTFLGLMGADRARDQAQLLSRQAIQHLDIFDNRADPLRAAARFAIDRRI
jgi:farnesyl diphosphate synthase